jgi:hypothetical protein
MMDTTQVSSDEGITLPYMIMQLLELGGRRPWTDLET